MKRRLMWIWGVAVATTGCGALRTVDAGGDAGTGDGGSDPGVVERDPDRDGDGIPDHLDTEPDAPQETQAEDDFSHGDDAWATIGDGEWSFEDGAVRFGGGCAGETDLSLLEAAGVSLADLYIEARLVFPDEFECDGRGAGVFLRRSSGFFACILRPAGARPIEDTTELDFALELLQVEGVDLASAVATRLSGGEPSSGHAYDPIDRWSEQDVIVSLTAEGNDLRCDACGLSLGGCWGGSTDPGFDSIPAPGTAGLAAWDTEAVFDDFLVVSLE